MYRKTRVAAPGRADGPGPKPGDQDAGWPTWPREHLWLWPDPSPSPVRARIRSVLADALGTLPVTDIERVAALAEADEPGAALRLTARLLRRQTDRDGWQAAHDLAASALLLAVIEYRDERAAAEFVRLVHQGDAGCAAGMRFDAGRYPPPLDRPRLLRERLQHRVDLAQSLVAASGAAWFRTLDPPGRWSDGDPLIGLTTGAQRPTAPGTGSMISTGPAVPVPTGAETAETAVAGTEVPEPSAETVANNEARVVIAAVAALPGTVDVRRIGRRTPGPKTGPALLHAKLPTRPRIRAALSVVQAPGPAGKDGVPAHHRPRVL